MTSQDSLQAHADQIRSSGILGRSELMLRLFDFLVSCSLAGKAPKEIEVAIDVFGKDSRFMVTQDAMVRVYIHKLRRKLEEYYSSKAREPGEGRLEIPRGEYRLVYIDSMPDSEPTAIADAFASPEKLDDVTPPVAGTSRWAKRSWALGLSLLLVANIAAWLSVRTPVTATDRLQAVRANGVWQDVVNSTQPITIVVGDYYIFGELDAPSPTNPESVRRLVREFNINSRNDLDQLLKARPELADRYMDLSLRYLPVSSAFALHNIVPLLESADQKSRQVQVILASDLTPTMIRSSHVVYIGLISGMGILRDIAFSGSQFRIGDTYDELVDRTTEELYVSQSSIAVNDNTRYRDYGYFSTFSGPDGNRIIILAGTRDVALMHTTEALSRPESIAELVTHARVTQDFEALYAVDAIDHVNLDGQLIRTEKLHTERIWQSGVLEKQPALASNTPTE